MNQKSEIIEIFEDMDTPHLSIDIAYDGTRFYLLEFQAIYFGTVGIFKSDKYYKFIKDKWCEIDNDKNLEKIYVESILYKLA